MPKQSVGVGNRPRFCNLCGQPLVAGYFRHGEGVICCVTCYAMRSRCCRCGAPLDDAALLRARAAGTDSKIVCTPCHRTAPHCAACHDPIVAVSYTFEDLSETKPQPYCEACVKSRPRCDVCRVPVAPAIAPLDDGQYRCALCAAQMVREPKLVEAVYREALTAFRQIVDRPLRATPHLEIVTRLQMGAVRRSHQNMVPGGEEGVGGHHVLGFFVRFDNVSSIYIERYLPRSILLGTLAHELGHAWQSEYAPQVHDLLACEGFAEWVAHHALVASGQRGMAARATRRDDVYGRGLRLYLNTERKKGRDGVLALARGERA
ncbi:MAG: hypothetical protein ACLQUY_29475 [Ktedonobacterales bacterium]